MIVRITDSSFPEIKQDCMRIMLATIMFLFMIQRTMGQDPIFVSDDTLHYGNSLMPGQSVIIPEVDYEETMKQWIKKLEAGTRSRAVRKGSELYIFGARLRSVFDDPVNVYSRLTEQDSAIKLQVAVELMKDEYAEGSMLDKIRTYLVDFAKDQYLSLVSKQVQIERRNLASLERKLASLQRAQENMERSNRVNNEIVKTEKEKLINLKYDLITITADINEYNEQLRSMTVDEFNNLGPHYLKNLEKLEKKTRKDIRSGEKKLSKAQNELERNRIEMPEVVKNREIAVNHVSEQEYVLQKFVDKYDIIKEFK